MSGKLEDGWLGDGGVEEAQAVEARCKRCGRLYGGLACPCIQDVADQESLKLLLSRKDQWLVLWRGHIRLRPGKAVCGRKGLPTGMNSRYILMVNHDQEHQTKVTCQKCRLYFYGTS